MLKNTLYFDTLCSWARIPTDKLLQLASYLQKICDKDNSWEAFLLNVILDACAL